MSPYESEAVKEIHSWKNPQFTWLDEAMRWINTPLDKAGDIVIGTPVGELFRKAVSGLVSLCNDLAQWTVRPNAILETFRRAGHDAGGLKDVLKLDLQDIDTAIGWLAAKYKGVALVEGVLAGSIGAPGIPPDVVALVTYNLRAVGEYATYCGFDITTQHERLFAMNVLAFASSPKHASKVLAMAQLERVAIDVAKKRAWKDLRRDAFVQIIERICKSLGVRLTKAKLLEILPFVGALVGGGFNVYFTGKVCDAAYFLYRERFLAAKYRNPRIIEESVPPAEDLDAGPGEEEGNGDEEGPIPVVPI